jgi:hypothetical protein
MPAATVAGVTNQEAATSANAVEPALKKLEDRAAQSKAGEAVVINEVLARVERMTATVAELHTIIEAIPVQRCPPLPEPAVCPPATTGTPAAAPPKASIAEPAPKPAAPDAKPKAADDALADIPWLPIVAALAVLALLGLLWRQRRQKDRGTETFPVTQPSVPPSLAKPATQNRKVSSGGTPPRSPEPAVVPAAPPSQQPTARPATTEPAAPAVPEVEAGGDTGTADADLSLELAEVMLSMGLTDGAAQTLTDHIRAHPRQALFHWLKLLDIYRKSGMKDDFEKSAQEIQQHFNMAPPDWDPAGTDTKSPDLESYAHIISRVQELWPRRSCAEYLNRLLEDNRGGTRSGFPQPVVEEILLLVALLKDLGR